jgi:hypothetical protein
MSARSVWIHREIRKPVRRARSCISPAGVSARTIRVTRCSSRLARLERDHLLIADAIGVVPSDDMDDVHVEPLAR